MRSRIHSVVVPTEIGEFAEEVRRIFEELGRTFGLDALARECSPPLDVFESDDAVEVTVDLPGVEASAVRVVVKGETVLIVGEKPSRRAGGGSSFHLVERGVGRFARTVRLMTACDSAKTRATLATGQLRVTIPKIGERRRRAILVAVQGEPPLLS
jgi:HSP20 family protein